MNHPDRDLHVQDSNRLRYQRTHFDVSNPSMKEHVSWSVLAVKADDLVCPVGYPLTCGLHKLTVNHPRSTLAGIHQVTRHGHLISDRVPFKVSDKDPFRCRRTSF